MSIEVEPWCIELDQVTCWRVEVWWTEEILVRPRSFALGSLATIG